MHFRFDLSFSRQIPRQKSYVHRFKVKVGGKANFRGKNDGKITKQSKQSV